MTLEPIAYRMKEAAEVARVSEKVIRAAMKDGSLKAVYPDSQPRIPAAALSAWIEGLPLDPPQKDSAS